MRNWLLFAMIVLVLLGPGASGRTWYVATNGDDNNPGTRSRPFASLGRAVEAARSVPQANARRILIRGGNYWGVAVRLNAADSGLVISGEPESDPVLYGGQMVSGFEPEGDRFWAADVPATAPVDFRVLVVNGRMAPRARHPATGRLTHLTEFKEPWMGTYGGGWRRQPTHDELSRLRVRPVDMGPFFETANAELTIYHEWDESMVGVRTYDPATGLVLFNTETGHPPGAFGIRDYVIWNTRDGLTQPGQWYLDRPRRKVVYWPLPAEDPRRLQAIFPTTEKILEIQGTAAHTVSNIVIRELTLAVANTPLKAGGFGAYAFDGALTADHIQQCRFAQLTVRHAAGQAVKLTHAFRCEVAASTFQELGAGGILSDGRELCLRNNEIHHVGLIYPSGIGLSCAGSDNQVTGSSIHDTPYVGLTCDGYRARIERNRLERVMQELHDGAGIYVGGTNHLIRANFCGEIGQSGGDRRHAYYLDEHARDSRLEGNLAVQCPSPLHNHMATNNVMVNNVFVHRGDLRLSFYRCAGHRLERNLIWAEGKIEVFRPEAVTVWDRNLFYSGTGTVLGYPVQQYSPGPAVPLRIEGVLITPVPWPVSRGQGTVRWSKASPAGRLSIQPIDVAGNGRDAGRSKRR